MTAFAVLQPKKYRLHRRFRLSFRGNVLDQLFNNIRLKTKLDALTFDCR